MFHFKLQAHVDYLQDNSRSNDN